MDDDEIGRPPRHARAKKKAETKKLVVAEEPGVVSLLCDGRSASCETFVKVPTPESMPAGVLRRLAERQFAGEMGVTCAPCLEQEAAEEEMAERAARRAATVESRRDAAGMPPKWHRQRFEHLDTGGDRGRAVELAQAWGAGDFDGLVLYGPVGRGKSALAAAAANLRIEQRPVRWLPVGELLMDLQGPFDSPERARATRKLDAARGQAALVLDDLDKLKPSEWAVQPLYVAINGWIEAELPLLVTLNRPLGELKRWLPETFGDAIASRLAGYCQQREVAGRDLRIVRAA